MSIATEFHFFFSEIEHKMLFNGEAKDIKLQRLFPV